MILFNPRDNHYCAPIDGEPLDYRAVNIEPSVMEQAVREITSREFIPRFTQNVVYRSDITQSVSGLYSAILRRASRLEKEEALFFLLEQVLQEYAAPFKEEDISKPDDRIQNLCTYTISWKISLSLIPWHPTWESSSPLRLSLPLSWVGCSWEERGRVSGSLPDFCLPWQASA